MDTCFELPEQHFIGQSGPHVCAQLSGQSVGRFLLWIITDICFGTAAQHLTGQSGSHLLIHDGEQTPFFDSGLVIAPIL